MINRISDFILRRRKKRSSPYSSYKAAIQDCERCKAPHPHYWLNGDVIDQYDSLWHHISYELRGVFEKRSCDLAVDRLIILIRGKAVVFGKPDRTQTRHTDANLAYAEWDIGGGLRLRADMYGDIRLQTETRNRDKTIFDTSEEVSASLQPIWKNKVRLLQEIWPRISVIPTAQFVRCQAE